MTDYPKTLAAARNALAKQPTEGPISDSLFVLAARSKALRDLLAALDAARSQAVASVQTITSLAGETRKIIVGKAEVIDALPVGTAVYAAPPAAAVPVWQEQLADSLDCFWNAAIDAERVGNQPAGAIAQGFAAVANRLREHAMLAAANKESNNE